MFLNQSQNIQVSSGKNKHKDCQNHNMNKCFPGYFTLWYSPRSAREVETDNWNLLLIELQVASSSSCAGHFIAFVTDGKLLWQNCFRIYRFERGGGSLSESFIDEQTY